MNLLTVKYLGQKVGDLGLAPSGVVFQYDPAFSAARHELSPFHLPLRPGAQMRDGGRLPGLFEDSLPDAWGTRVMREWFRQQKISASSITPLTMLAYVGERGMGALTYEPATILEAESDPAIVLVKI